jgi:long-chain acyl-CoA synthetase
LWQEVNRAAALFGGYGLAQGERLAIHARTCREWQVAELGANLAGAAVVGIDRQASDEQVAWTLEHGPVTGLLVEQSSSLARIPSNIRGRLRFVLRLDTLLETLAAVGDDGASVKPSPAPDMPAMLIYTSGTTGPPKGIEYTHAQLMTACWTILDGFPHFEHGRFVCWLPMSALFQRMMNLTAIASGSVTYFVEDPREIVSRLPEIRPTVFTSVPRFYEKVHDGIQEQLARHTGTRRRLIQAALAAGTEWSLKGGTRPDWTLRLRHRIFDRLVLRRLRDVMGGKICWMISGSAATPIWVLEFFQRIGLVVLEAYGVTENPIPIAANRPDTYRFGSVGKPFSMNDVRIAEDGEVLVKGPTLFRGYVGERDPREHFTTDGYYRTGDYGHFDSDGFLYLRGRASEIIKTSTGRRVSPSTIEGVYRQSRYVDQIVIVGNNRPFLAALIAVNQPAVRAALDRLSLPIPPGDGLQSSSHVTDLIDRDLAALGRKLARHERIRAFTVLSKPLSTETGELTVTLKLRRERIEALHTDAIDKMYDRHGQMLDEVVHASQP